MKRVVCATCLAASLAIPLHAAEHFWDEIPASPSTTRPSVVLDGYWNSEFQRVNREVAAANDCQLVFFGDSITWSWSLGPATGKAIWENQFGPLKPINMGNSGDITPVMLHRVTRGNLDFPAGQHPKVAVLLCGINNFGVTKSAGGKEKWDMGINCPPQDIANGQRAVAQVFRHKLPHTRLIMMALLPVADRAKWKLCQEVNAIQAAVTRDSTDVAFINPQDRFLQADGFINKSLYTDGLHLSAEGYQTSANQSARGRAHRQMGLGHTIRKADPLAPPQLQEVITGEGTLILKLDTWAVPFHDGPIQGFAIAGKDGRFQPATAQWLDKNAGKGAPNWDRATIVLSSELVPEPVYFRYAWARNPLETLKSSDNAGLPFDTQRNDPFTLADMYQIYTGKKPSTPGVLHGGEIRELTSALKAEDMKRRIEEARKLLNQK